MEPVTTIYYSVKSATAIARLAIEFKKTQELGKLNVELNRLKDISNSILLFTSLIRDDIQTLMHMHFKSAFENLNYALNAAGGNREDYLRHAKSKFIEASTIEKNENLILSYLGLALCQSMTNDQSNSIQTLNKIKDVTCCLPEDYDTLCKMFPYNDKWFSFLIKLGFNIYRLIEREISVLKILDKCDYDLDVKYYIERRIKAIEAKGGFTFMEPEKFINNDKRALRSLLEEDFDSFKSTIIKTFAIK